MSIGELMIDGNICQKCGQLIYDKEGEIDEPGYPQTCKECLSD